ncbi:hypothetical protein MKX03_037601 [Papaver bracteatum]|nr:hypothetical protein MKX03_037601 [Papaver bracteatum]
MELLLLLIISASYLLVGVVGSHAAPLPSEIYWKNKLPNTPMPTILHDLLHPAEQEGKPLTDVRTRSGNAYTPTQENTLSAQPNWQRYTYSKKPLTQQLNLSKYKKHPHSQQFKLSKYSKNQPLGKNTIPSDNAAINRQLLDSPGASLFFLEKDFYPGEKMNLHFVVSTASGTTFLPQKLAKVTPFSSKKLPEILNQFAINPKSEDAEVINQTIMDCEEPALENEEKYCATSLESLIEYGTSKIGKNVDVLTTVIVADKGQRTRMRKQQYVVSSGSRQIVSNNLVACHSLPYPNAVFFCHATSAHTTRAYDVPLVGADGTKIKAAAVCHKDTSKWDPGHVAFQVLKVGVVGNHASPPLPSEIYWKNNKYIKTPHLGKSTIPNDNATNRELLDSLGASLFFLEKDLYPGAKMNLHFVVSTASGTTFLPRNLAKVTPFSSNKLPEILNQFAISPNSEEAAIINEIIMDFEEPAIKNEEKYCATSLESLVEYGTSKFGKNVNVLTTEISHDKAPKTRTRKQQYVVSSGVRQIVSGNLVACHGLPYPYAVFFCHATLAHTTRASVVPLIGADGTEVKATAVCHKDTSKWDPDHVAFQVLKVKPGTIIPICHFLTEDNIVWAGKN